MIKGTYKVTTLGCKVNKAESIEIERQLAENGFRKAEGEEVPEYWVVNTCAVTAVGMQKSRKAVSRCSRTGANVIVTGCGVDFNSVEFDSAGPAGLVSNLDKEMLVNDMCGLNRGGAAGLEVENRRIPVKVQDGCMHNCSYCIVPKLRTRQWSMKKESVIEKIKFYEEMGVGEIILCGVDLGNYRDGGDGTGLPELVESVIKRMPEMWIRLSSISIRDISEKLIWLLKEENSLCRHIHLPLQSGDDGVLKSMNRGYSISKYLEKIRYIRKAVPDISITTDIMVGYPTESEEAFLNTVSALHEAGFSRVHIFRYSPRPATEAYVLGDPVNGKEKKRRSRVLAYESKGPVEAFHKKFLGDKVKVLVEEESTEADGLMVGRTQWYSEVRFEGSPEMVGKKVDVIINDIDGVVLSGLIAEGS